MQLSVGGYVCERELGRGGQGVVWLARDRTGRQVVVKFLLPGKEYDEVALARVRREFGAASRVGELATARVLDADLTARHPYIVSEYVPGPTIHQHVAANGPLPSGRLQSLALAVAHALAQVHRVSVVHRDIKPSNILLSPDGPRIIDFGIARDDRLLESALTTPGSVLGSPAYMSPEQVQSRGVTAASDVFSLGGTLYFAATGRHPFDGESDYEVLVAVCTRDADLTEKMAAFEAYGSLCGAGGVSTLDSMLNGKSLFGHREDAELRACAAVALGRIGTTEAQAVLRQAANEKDVVVRNAVTRALRTPGASQ